MELRHSVSSANMRILDEATDRGRSLMNMMKRRDPRILPFGTPETTGRMVDWDPLMVTIVYG